MRELLLASLGGRQYGIWKDEILSVRDIHSLHRIPFSPDRIAGIMIDDGKTVTLRDLSVCIGYETFTATDQGSILLMEVSGKVTGFVANFELRTLSVSPDFLFPLPDYLKTTVLDTCAVHDGISIPIINISELYSRELETGKEASGFSHNILVAQPHDISGAERIRFFTVAGERYAAPATDMEEKAVKPGPITPLPDTPGHVKGVTSRDGRLLTVIDLTRRVKHQTGAAGSIMLIAKVADAAFGFLVDSDEGASSADKIPIKPAPLIAQSSWLKHLVVRDGEPVPFIDLAMVLSTDSGVADETPIWQRYATGSAFPDAFFRHDVEVVEFLLLGVRYALPKVEVKEVIAIKPCRALPDVPPIVIGVAEHNGEVLPVMDLAMMFGRRSLATPDWRMMLVSNGDFRALVITEAVIGERRLPLDMHRTVPIHLPHNLMYGCYPDGNAVRVILNVEAISVHFDKSLIQKFMPALSQEMRMSPTTVVHAFPEEKADQAKKTGPAEITGEELQPLANETLSRPDAEPVTEAVPAVGPSPEESGFEQQAVEEVAEFVGWEAADTVAFPVAPEPEPIDMSSAAVPPADEWNDGVASEQERVQQVSEKAITPEAMTAAAESPKHIPVKDVPDRELSGEDSKAREPESVGNKSPLEVLKASAKKKKKQKVSATATADSRLSAAIHAMASAKNAEPYRMNREAEPLAAWSVYEERAAGRAWKRRIGYGAIIAVLMVVVYFSVTFDKPGVEKSVQGTAPVKVEQAPVQPEQARTEAVPMKTEAEQANTKAQAGIQAKAKRAHAETTRETLVLSPLTDEQTEPPRAGKEIRAPLELDIPANKPVEIDVYVVREGDTLWSISEHFTGSPYNYPRIAGQNRIAEPDLIFPGQRIRLIK